MQVTDLAVIQRRPDLAVGYLTVLNPTAQSLEIRAVTSLEFETIEMHETIMDGDIMKMRSRDSVRVPARGQTRFERGGLHLMLFGPRVEPGDPYTLTFEFATGMRVEIGARLGES